MSTTEEARCSGIKQARDTKEYIMASLNCVLKEKYAEFVDIGSASTQ